MSEMIRPQHAKESYSDTILKKLHHLPNICRFRQGHGVFGGIFCTHSDFSGYACIEDYCLSAFERKWVDENFSPKAWSNRQGAKS